MTSVDAFLGSILDVPDADEPRLVFADWLEDQGDPLADLIRVQCELARLGKFDARYPRLEEREQQLLRKFGDQWLGPIRALGLIGRFRRGLMEVTITGTTTLLQSAAEIFRLPWVLHVHLQDCYTATDSLRDLAASPWFGRLQSLDLRNATFGNEGCRQLALAPVPCQLTHLTLNNVHMTTDGVRLITEIMDLRRLTELRLHGNRIGAVGPRCIARAAALSQLRVLDISENRIGTEGGVYLSESPYLNHLKALYVGGNSIRMRGLKALRRRFGSRVSIERVPRWP